VYIREAHAADSDWPVKYAKEQNINEPTNHKQRCDIADKLVKEKKLTMPCLIDNLDNKVDKAYNAKPTRVFVVRKDGTLGVSGGRGPWGLKPSLEDTRKWLKTFKETGEELVIPRKERKRKKRNV
jgi:hypothetical protein